MRRKNIIVIAGVVLLLVVAFAGLFYATFGDMISRMRAGRRYMESLSQGDCSEWIGRTMAFLKSHPVTNDHDVVWLYAPDVPEELKKLKIQRVDVLKDEVRYVWVGGLDHTLLSVHRTGQGFFEFYAQYDDERGRVLWTKESDANNIRISSDSESARGRD